MIKSSVTDTQPPSARSKIKSHLCFHGFVTASSPGVVATPVSGSRVAFVAFSLRITAFLVIGQKCHVSFFWSEVPCFFLGFSTFAKKEASALGVVFSRNHSWNKFGGDAALQLMSEKYLLPFFLLKNQRLEYHFRNGVQRIEKGQNYLLLRFIPQCAEPSIFFPQNMDQRAPIITFLPQD